MNLNAVIEQIRAYSPVFSGRVAGAAQFKVLPESANMLVPAAYVVPMDDNAGEQQSQNGYQQIISERFAVIAVISNAADERGQTSSFSLHDVRASIFRALLGWIPEDDVERYGIVEYEGGALLDMDRSRLWYQFEFACEAAIDRGDTWIFVRDNELPAFEGMDIKVDMVDPAADPNHPFDDHPTDPNAYEGGYPGPDGRIESGANIDVEQ